MAKSWSFCYDTLMMSLMFGPYTSKAWKIVALTFKNIFSVPQKNESFSGLERHEGE